MLWTKISIYLLVKEYLPCVLSFIGPQYIGSIVESESRYGTGWMDMLI
jgi:hypothetical protein